MKYNCAQGAPDKNLYTDLTLVNDAYYVSITIYIGTKIT